MSKAPEVQWLCRAGNKQRGPFSTAQIRAALKSGKLPPETPVSRVGSEKWVKASGVKVFAEVLSQAAPEPALGFEQPSDESPLFEPPTLELAPEPKQPAAAVKPPVPSRPKVEVVQSDNELSEEAIDALLSWRRHMKIVAILFFVWGALTALSGIGFIFLSIGILFLKASGKLQELCDEPESYSSHLTQVSKKMTQVFVSTELGCGAALIGLLVFFIFGITTGKFSK